VIFKLKSVEAGYIFAQNTLGLCYRHEIETNNNINVIKMKIGTIRDIC